MKATTAFAVAFAILALDAKTGQSDEGNPPYDFYIAVKTCKALTASSAGMDKGILVIEDKPDAKEAFWACSNSGKRKVACDQSLEGETSKHVLTITVDAGDTLIMSDEFSTYWMYVDRPSHVANITVRMITDRIGSSGARAIGTQLCQGIYLTADEAAELQKRNEKRTK